MIFYTDGSSTIGVKSAYCVTDEKGQVIAFEETRRKEPIILEKTNNAEEYRGVITALKLCKEGDEICTDSLLVVNQIKGAYKVKQDHLKPLFYQAKVLLAEKRAKLTWISRKENLAGKVFE